MAKLEVKPELNLELEGFTEETTDYYENWNRVHRQLLGNDAALVKEVKEHDSAENTVTFDDADPEEEAGLPAIENITSGEKHKTIFSKLFVWGRGLSKLITLLGSTDITEIGDGTVTSALAALKEDKLDIANLVNDLTTETEGCGLDARIGAKIKANQDTINKLMKVAFTGAYADLSGTPQSMKNPNALTFTGGSTEVYDGSDPKSVAVQTPTGDTKDNVITYSSGDSLTPTGWTDVELIKSGEKHASLLAKLSTIAGNARYLWKLLGSSDISKIGNGTVTSALAALMADKLNRTDIVNDLVSQATDKALSAAMGKQLQDAVNKLNTETSKTAAVKLTPKYGSNYDGGCYYYTKNNRTILNVEISGLSKDHSYESILSIPSNLLPKHTIAFWGVDATTINGTARLVVTTSGIILNTMGSYAIIRAEWDYD